MGITKRTVIRCLLLFLLSPAFSQAPSAKSPSPKQPEITKSHGSMKVLVNGPRPLAQALDALTQEYSWVVSYEDPRFTSKTELRVSKQGEQTLPAGGQFSFQFRAKKPDEEKVLQLAVDSYNKSNNPGQFTLKKVGPDMFVAVGSAARDDKGEWLKEDAILDAPVTIPAGNRSVSETLSLICHAIAEKKGVDVNIGITPKRILDSTQVQLGGGAAPARDLVLQALASTNGHLYWRLLFDPNSKAYWLDVHHLRSPSSGDHPPKRGTRRENSTPDAGTGSEPLSMVLEKSPPPGV